jgi:hypothetical protein
MSYQLSAISSQPDRKIAGLSLWTLGIPAHILNNLLVFAES